MSNQLCFLIHILTQSKLIGNKAFKHVNTLKVPVLALKSYYKDIQGKTNKFTRGAVNFSITAIDCMTLVSCIFKFSGMPVDFYFGTIDCMANLF